MERKQDIIINIFIFYFRPQVSPGRTPSPMEYSTYNPSLVQQQYQPNIHPIMPNVPVTMNVQAYSYMDQLQLQPEPNLLMLNRVTSENQEESQPANNISKSLFLMSYNFSAYISHFENFNRLNIYFITDINVVDTAGAPCLLDMDSQQFNFDWNSADLADFGANLSANLSTGLSISDSIQVSRQTHSSMYCAYLQVLKKLLQKLIILFLNLSLKLGAMLKKGTV